MFYLFIYKGKGLGLFFFFLRENTINFNLAEADDCNFSSHGWLPFVASKKKKLTTSIGNKVGKKAHSFSHKDSSLHGKEAVCYLVHQAFKEFNIVTTLKLFSCSRSDHYHTWTFWWRVCGLLVAWEASFNFMKIYSSIVTAGWECALVRGNRNEYSNILFSVSWRLMGLRSQVQKHMQLISVDLQLIASAFQWL